MIKKAVLITSSICTIGLSFTGCTQEKFTSGEPQNPICIAPAKPGGGFDLTCKLAQDSLSATDILDKPMQITYMPGGVGAVAYNKIISNDPANDNAIVAFSTGSLLNIAQGKFGKYTEKDVRWLSVIGTDYGMVAVKVDSPYKNLNDLVKALKANPQAVSFGAGGSIGGQDWIQTAMLAKVAGIDPKKMTYIPLEGGGEAVIAVLNDHIQVVSAGVAEIVPHIKSGQMRVLAVFSKDRLPGSLASIPTAKEQGFDIEWPVIRGYYMGPKVSNEAYNWWKASFDTMAKNGKFEQIRQQYDLLPLTLTGDELTQYVYQQTNKLRELSKDYNLTNK